MKPIVPLLKTIILSCVVLVQVNAVAAKGHKPAGGVKVTAGNFRKWEYSPTSVFGIGALDSIRHRYYVKISSINANTVKVERYNPVGILLNKTMLYFTNGIINKTTETNRWGEEYSQSYFTKSAEGEYFVATRTRGVNVYLPCKKLKKIYKDNVEKEARYYDDSGMACTCGTGAGIIRYKRHMDADRFSLTTEMTFYSEADSPVISSALDFHKIIYGDDEHGNHTSERYFGDDGLPIATRMGIYGTLFHQGLINSIFDEDYINAKGQVINNVIGVARIEDIYNDDNFVIMEVNYNAQFKVTRTSPLAGGIAVTKFKRDSRGNDIEETYYDENDKPLNKTEGYQKIVSVYSARNMLTDESYFDASSLPVADNSNIHHYNYEMDSVGRVITTKYFDKVNKPCQDNVDRVYQKKYRYDNYGRRVAESYWDQDGKPMLRWNGYHETRSAYNDDGRPVEISYFDIAGNFAKSSNGFSKQKMEYNNKGVISLRSYYDGDTAIMWGSSSTISHFHSIRYSYDALKRITMIEYLDTSNNPVDASIDLRGGYYTCNRIEFFYKGSQVAEEKLYRLNTTDPVADIDCSKSRYVSVSGTGIVAPR